MIRQPVISIVIGLSLLGIGSAGLFQRLTYVEDSNIVTVATAPEWLDILIASKAMRREPEQHLVEPDKPYRQSPKLLINLKIAPPKPRTKDVAVLTASTRIDSHASYKLFGLLTSVGVDIEPKGLVPFTSTSADEPELYTATWAIRAKEANLYPLIFAPTLKMSEEQIAKEQALKSNLINSLARNGHRKSPEPNSTTGVVTPDDVLPDLSVKDGTVVQLDVTSRWTDYLAKGWPPFVTFMGSLLTLPGIISYLENRRKSKQRPDPEPTEPSPF